MLPTAITVNKGSPFSTVSSLTPRTHDIQVLQSCAQQARECFQEKMKPVSLMEQLRPEAMLHKALSHDAMPHGKKIDYKGASYSIEDKGDYVIFKPAGYDSATEKIICPYFHGLSNDNFHLFKKKKFDSYYTACMEQMDLRGIIEHQGTKKLVFHRGFMGDPHDETVYNPQYKKFTQEHIPDASQKLKNNMDIFFRAALRPKSRLIAKNFKDGMNVDVPFACSAAHMLKDFLENTGDKIECISYSMGNAIMLRAFKILKECDGFDHERHRDRLSAILTAPVYRNSSAMTNFPDMYRSLRRTRDFNQYAASKLKDALSGSLSSYKGSVSPFDFEKLPTPIAFRAMVQFAADNNMIDEEGAKILTNAFDAEMKRLQQSKRQYNKFNEAFISVFPNEPSPMNKASKSVIGWTLKKLQWLLKSPLLPKDGEEADKSLLASQPFCIAQFGTTAKNILDEVTDNNGWVVVTGKNDALNSLTDREKFVRIFAPEGQQKHLKKSFVDVDDMTDETRLFICEGGAYTTTLVKAKEVFDKMQEKRLQNR